MTTNGNLALKESAGSPAGAAALRRDSDRMISAIGRLAEIQSASESFDSLASTLPGVVYQRLVSPEGDIRYTYISEGVREYFGLSPEQVLENSEVMFSTYTPEYRENFRKKLVEAGKQLKTWDVEASIVGPDGRTRYTHAIARPSAQPDGSVLWTGVILDATRIKEAEGALAAAEAKTRTAIIESLSQGFIMFGADGVLVMANTHVGEMLPGMANATAPGVSYSDIVRCEVAQHCDPAFDTEVFEAKVAERLMLSAEGKGVFECKLFSGTHILVNEHKTENGDTVIIYTDISQLKQREEEIAHLAYHDVLTGLPNRVLLHKRMEEALAAAEREGKSAALVYLDLDRFKSVNDTLGHPAGDALLVAVGEKLKQNIRERDTAARLGGDEFAVLLTDIPEPDVVPKLARRLLEAISQPIDYNGQQIFSTVSIGIAFSGSDGSDPDQLARCADLALYKAKADGRATFRFFEAEMNARAQERRNLEIDLRRALADEDLQIHYQPLVDAFTDEIVGFEALVRWTHPVRGEVTPVEFIPLAEETGVIVKLGEYVLRKACVDAAGWPEPVRVAVNLSPAQFQNHDFADLVKLILEETGLEAGRLELEITESLLLRDTASNLATLRELKTLGVRISMDDFGTGYSSLANLLSFPFDKIKIDRSFVSGLEGSPDSAAIIRAVLSLGKSLGMTTTAEGVETRDQLAYLRSEGCIEVQGFFYSKPTAAENVANMLEKGVGRKGGRR